MTKNYGDTYTRGEGGTWFDPMPDAIRSRRGSSIKFWLKHFNPDGTRRPEFRPRFIPDAVEVAAGKVPPPSAVGPAVGGGPLDGSMRAMEIGEVIPIVFCRRRYSAAINTVPGAMAMGGVLLTPPATEARFELTSQGIDVAYHCVLGEGQMGDVQVRDVRRGSCRVGEFSQNYNQRAGSWAPGLYGTAPSGVTPPEFPNFTGGGGSYEGLSTIEFRGSSPYGIDSYQTQWNVFVRDGMIIQRGRLIDGVVGPSDNIADLVLYALQVSSRVPADLIDLNSFYQAALFTEVNNMWFNGEIREAGNLEDYLTRILPYFLLRLTKVGGKYALRPLITTLSNGLINASPVAPAAVLSEPHIIPDSFSISYSDAASRKPTALQMLWRQQQFDDDVPVPRSLELALAGVSSPFEQHDLSGFCTNELHAARAATYVHARRYLSTHTATVKLRPGGQSGVLAEGDVIRIQLDINPSRDARGQFVETYQVEAISRAWTGEEQLTLSHFPINASGTSLITIAVAVVGATGTILPSQRSNGSCDLPGRGSDGSAPTKSTSGTPLPASASRISIPNYGGYQVQQMWPGTTLPQLPAGPNFLPVNTVQAQASYSPVVIVSNGKATRTLTITGVPLLLKVTIAVSFTKCDDSISSTGVCLGTGAPFYDEIGMRLIGPNGTSVVLIKPSVTYTSGGVSPGNSFTFTFDDDAAEPISASLPPSGTLVSGTYRPHSPLSVFSGINANGTWTLEVEDQGGRDPLSLNAWNIWAQAPAQIP